MKRIVFFLEISINTFLNIFVKNTFKQHQKQKLEFLIFSLNFYSKLADEINILGREKKEVLLLVLFRVNKFLRTVTETHTLQHHDSKECVY